MFDALARQADRHRTDPRARRRRSRSQQGADPAPDGDRSCQTKEPRPTRIRARRASDDDPRTTAARRSPSDQVSLRRRLLNVRTIGSLVFGLLLLFLLFRVVFGDNFDWGEVARLVGQANPVFLLLAFVAYYATFPLRGLRWRYVLGADGMSVGFRDATEILFLSWFVNCLVPAKLGDLYRAYLLRANYGGLDLAHGRDGLHRAHRRHHRHRVAGAGRRLLVVPRPLAARTSTRSSSSASSSPSAWSCWWSRCASSAAHIGRWLPARIGELWDRFHEGSTGALTVRSIPVILALTVVSGCSRARASTSSSARSSCRRSGSGISASMFVALAAALLTAIPLTPAGFGFVEAGIIGVLSCTGCRRARRGGRPGGSGLTILTVIVLGGILYAFSAKVRRAHGADRRHPPAEPERGRRPARPAFGAHAARYLSPIETDQPAAAMLRLLVRTTGALTHRWRTAHEGRR